MTVVVAMVATATTPPPTVDTVATVLDVVVAMVATDVVVATVATDVVVATVPVPLTDVATAPVTVATMPAVTTAMVSRATAVLATTATPLVVMPTVAVVPASVVTVNQLVFQLVATSTSITDGVASTRSRPTPTLMSETPTLRRATLVAPTRFTARDTAPVVSVATPRVATRLRATTESVPVATVAPAVVTTPAGEHFDRVPLFPLYTKFQ